MEFRRIPGFPPFGIEMRSRDVPYKSVPQTLQSSIEKRAKSASSILGRRHFETGQQNILESECIEGKALFPKERDDDSCKDSQPKTRQGRYCGTSSCYGNYRNRILSYRPSTSYEMDKFDGPQSTTRLHRKNDKCLSTEKSFEFVTREIEVRKCRICTDLEAKKEPSTRARSAPASMEIKRYNITEEGLCDTPRSPRTPIYWKTRSDYQKRQIAEHTKTELEPDTVFIPRGSLLKPMMFSNYKLLKHSAGCPYQCRGCFKACLTSTDYFQNIKEQKKKAKISEEKVRTQLYHRRVVAHASSQPIQWSSEKSTL